MRASRAPRVAAVLVGLVALAVAVAGCASGTDADDARDGARDPVSEPAGDPAAGSQPEVDLPTLRRAEAPWQVARQIEVTEAMIRDGSGPVESRVGRLNQLAYRTLAERPGWDARVRELVAPRFRSVVRDTVAARREMLAMQRSYEPHTELPAWRIVAPEPAATLREHYREAERRSGVGWEYLAAINLLETGMGRIVGDSVADARGPMQFIDETWERYGRGEVTDPRDAILAAGRYLAARGFEAGDRAAIDDALYAYNNHPAYVRAIRLHAEVMERNPRAYLGYHAWDVVFTTARGDVTLPVGYGADDPIPVDRWLAENPQP